MLCLWPAAPWTGLRAPSRRSAQTGRTHRSEASRSPPTPPAREAPRPRRIVGLFLTATKAFTPGSGRTKCAFQTSHGRSPRFGGRRSTWEGSAGRRSQRWGHRRPSLGLRRQNQGGGKEADSRYIQQRKSKVWVSDGSRGYVKGQLQGHPTWFT